VAVPADQSPAAGGGQGAQAGLRHGIHLPIFAEPADLVELGVRAERAGWDGCLLWDHVLGSREMAMPMADPWVVLGALAVRTSRIRLGTAVTPVARRRPWKLARETVTVDRLSAGRLVLGVGLGEPPDAEYAAFGEPADRRVLAAMTDEGLEVLAGLWSGKELSLSGRYYRVERATFVPGPVQQPRVPVWIACTWPHRRPLERAARWDGMVVTSPTADGGIDELDAGDLAELVAEVRGRRPAGAPFEVAVVTPGVAAPELAGAYQQAGATWLLATGWLDTLGELIDRGPAR
jgi:alkanesulfonate monooxygenase SsuD/methylene tetrahydromethanopterin reductase-like flavin-dependent oxidoreductase (luciferase family)